MSKKYGKTKEEISAEKMLICRNIVKEVLNFGIDEDQKLQIIKLLSLELEDNEAMKRICISVKEVKDSEHESKNNNKLLNF